MAVYFCRVQVFVDFMEFTYSQNIKNSVYIRNYIVSHENINPQIILTFQITKI